MTAHELLDPTSELAPARRERAPRPSSLEGSTIALLDIAKARGDVFLDRLGELLTQRGLRVERFRKPTFTKVLPRSLGREIGARCQVVIEALAD
jgi:hypothetical protein